MKLRPAPIPQMESLHNLEDPLHAIVTINAYNSTVDALFLDMLPYLASPLKEVLR